MALRWRSISGSSQRCSTTSTIATHLVPQPLFVPYPCTATTVCAAAASLSRYLALYLSLYPAGVPHLQENAFP